MYRKICWYTALLILLVFTIVGCDKLSKYDLSGQIEMELKTDGSTYRKIHEFDDYGGDLSDLIPRTSTQVVGDIVSKVLFDFRRSDVFNISNLFILLEFIKDLTVGGDTYTFKVDFIENPPDKFNYLQIFNSQREEIPLTILKDHTEIGRTRIDLKEDEYGTDHKGDCLAYFVESVTNRKYLISVKYYIECTPGRENKDDSKYSSPSSITISIEAKIGNPHYLQGTLELSEEESIRVQALDWDLDGMFTNNDRVRMDGENYPLNKPFKIGKGKKEKEYVITLEPGDDEGEKFFLNIKRTDE